MKDKHLIVDDLDIRYTEQGEGPVVLLLHGWGTNLETFNELLTELEGKSVRFVSLDLPGFGKSEAPKEEWDISRYVKFVRAFLDKLSIDNPHVVIGHSFGGRIAIKAVASNLIKPERLVLIASAGTAKSRSFRNALFAVIAKTGKIVSFVPPFCFFRKIFRDKLYKVAGATDYLNAGKMKDTFLKIIHENLTDDARAITALTLLIWGEKDTETPLAEACTLKDAISGSVLEILPDAGHFAHQCQARAVAEKISQFAKL